MKRDPKGIIYASLDEIQADEAALSLIPKELAQRLKVFPLSLKEGKLRLLCPRSHDLNLINDLRFLSGKWIEIIPSEPFFVLSAIERFYSETATQIETSPKEDLTFKSFIKNNGLEIKRLRQEVEKTPIVKLVNNLISRAIVMGASDIHLEPFDKEFKVRYRLDGMLTEMEPITVEKKAAVVSRIKIMAELDIAERRRPQDGRIRVEGENRVIDIRVSTLPTDFGEKVVLRILDKTQLKLDLENLGFDQRSLHLFREKIKLPYGMILVTGPTGSGKTTTLYAALNHIKNPMINILTIEDPIEYTLEGINQSQVKSEISFTFANALRSFLRQDPNVIMVGEIRDYETVEIAIRASLTGHLVLSTLHTNDAPTAVTRLLDMGAEPFLVSSSVTLVLAQRLVRKICLKCREAYQPSEFIVEKLCLSSEEIKDIVFYKGFGCPFCNQTGHAGRIAVFEIMPVTPKIAEMIDRKANSSEIKKEARVEGMLTLREDAINKMKKGITTAEEVLRETSEIG